MDIRTILLDHGLDNITPASKELEEQRIHEAIDQRITDLDYFVRTDFHDSLIDAMVTRSTSAEAYAKNYTDTQINVVNNAIDNVVITWDQVTEGEIKLGGTNNEKGELAVYSENEEEIEISLNPRDDERVPSSGFQKINARRLFLSEMITAPNIITRNAALLDFFIDPVNGDDNNKGDNFARALRSVQAAVQRIPKFLSYDVSIYIHEYNGPLYEQILFEGFHGPGALTLDFQIDENKLYGKILCRYNTAPISVNKGNIIATSTDSPFEAIGNQSIKCFETVVDAANQSLYGFHIINSFAELDKCKSFHATDSAIFGSKGALVEVRGCAGSALYGLKAQGPSVIAGDGTAPLGTTADKIEVEGGSIRGTFTHPAVTEPVTPTPTAYTTVTLTSTSQKSWRPKDGGEWNRDEVAQGNHNEQGQYKGFWFFGTDFDQFNNKTIKKIRIRAKRHYMGGINFAQNARFLLHGYETQPAALTEPLYYNGDATAVSVTDSFQWGEEKWIDATSAFKGYMNAAEVKGIGLCANNDDPYLLFATPLEVEVTYET